MYLDALKRPDANERTTRLAPNGKRSNLSNAIYHLVRTKRFKDWFGDWEKVYDLSVNLSGMSKEEAMAKVANILGEPLVNAETGISAVINSTQKNKLFSNAASRKSSANGFDYRIHDAAVGIIDKLWKHASLFETRDDKNNDPNIKSIKRFVSPLRYGTNVAFAYITAKESVQNGHRIYSLELESVNAIEGMLAMLREQSPASTTLTEKSLLKIAESVNGVSKVVDENGELMVVYHGTNKKFTVFDKDRQKYDPGFFFAENRTRPKDGWTKEYAEYYGGNVMPVFLRNADKLSRGEWRVENPNDIKSADPVTYDDAGNVIPLSERPSLRCFPY